ncbi:MAG: hypothetical protein Q4P18_05840 [Methanobrevibacter sp.]|uniref:hypothetical protein n=1 Tax=Methanobrevibacter sp. TaxID=66852 RepID=UPI0026DFFA7F|nr:hypothetical protein [Methanobrevibacter sp.]MDO5849035.1 hypothetical protein [Methanobrevibacter sp.]
MSFISKKSKKQISKAISNYKSEYGIIISNTTQNIEREDNIIYLPLKTFFIGMKIGKNKKNGGKMVDKNHF